VTAGERERSRIVFVGGTGRSGTHITAALLGNHSQLYDVPIECRFHCNPRGLADLVTGKATPEEFLAKLRGFWWHRVRWDGDRSGRLRRALGMRRGEKRVRGLHQIMESERFEAAVSRFEAGYERDLLQASRDLFLDLLWPLAEDAGKPTLVEMSCFTIAGAPGLARILPEARFVHSVRDGRDSGASKVSLRQKPHHPTDATSGIDFWAERLRMAEEGVRGLPEAEERLHTISLDELVWGDRDATYRGLLDFLGVADETGVREFFDREMNASAAHRERWREGLSKSDQAEVEEHYERTLERLEREGYQCAALLRRSYERREPAAVG
jgi:Sulfotransferase family